jgi:metal-responsive CopG/Arc/MetJ family transcriptional regulator
MAEDKNLRDPGTGVTRVNIGIVIHPDLLAAVDELSQREHRSRSNMIEQLIRNGLVVEASSGPLA